MKAARAAFVVSVGVAAVAALAYADHRGRKLHDYFPAEEAEALAASPHARGSEDFAATIETPSGPIKPPDLGRPNGSGPTYRRDTEPSSPSFEPDRDTRRPDHESYDDPFTPQLTPYKRMFAFDAVRDDYSLYVREPELHAVPLGGGVIDGEDRFFADLSLELVAGESVRIPTPGAGARLLAMESAPAVDLTVSNDGADNWFVRSTVDKRTRIVLSLSVPRQTFAADYPEVSWRALPVVPAQPSSHRDAFERVAGALGLTPRMSPREVVQRMTEYFRSFAPSTESPTAHGDIYLDLALSKKGVCRHRAFAFLVTALHAGIPTRLVHNEAHAWVEVRDDRLWHRIDLGGAAVDLEGDPHLDRPRHVSPPDSFPWPNGRDSGDELGAGERLRAEREAAALSRRTNADSSSDERDAQTADGEATVTASPADDPEPGAWALVPGDRPPSEVRIESIDHDLFRGRPMRLRGTVTSKGEPCARLGVDVVVTGRGTKARVVGSLATDERGLFDGAVSLPRDLTVGDYELNVVTAGSHVCGPGRSK